MRISDWSSYVCSSDLDSCSQWPLREVAMARDGLFEDLPEQPGPERAAGRARLREPERDQIELRAVDLDRLIGAEHTARVIWAYVEKLDRSALEEGVREREHQPGQAAHGGEEGGGGRRGEQG